jgi:uncharacterized protein (DUF58 family)
MGREPQTSARGVTAAELLARVRAIRLRTLRQVSSALAGGYKSSFRGSGIEFEEVRPYMVGDDVRSIDWKVTARKSEPHIKTFREDRQLSLHLLVDSSISMDFGTRRVTKRELAAEFAALLSYVALESRDQVGLTLYADERLLHLSPGRSAAHVNRVVREVIAMQPAPVAANLGRELEERLRGRDRHGLYFVVSDFRRISAAGDEAAAERELVRKRLVALGDRHDVIVVPVSDPFESELPKVGLIEMLDPETGRRAGIDTSSRRVRAAWKAAADARAERLARLFRRSRVGVIPLSTPDGVANPVIRFFKARAHGRRSA